MLVRIVAIDDNSAYRYNRTFAPFNLNPTPLDYAFPMSSPRFFHPQLPLTGHVSLDDAEARHASNVLRLAVGADVTLFDGQGGEAQGVVASLGKREVVIELIARSDSNRELDQEIELLVALPKGDRQKTLVDGLVQLGVTRLTPLICERGVAQPTDAALERLQRSVVESSKQCGRNQLMCISTPQAIAQLTQPVDLPHDRLLLVAHPYGSQCTLRQVAADGHACPHKSARLAVGPEGGFSDAEIALWLDAGWRCVDLGPRILRIEMAALQLAAWWATR